MFLLKYKIIKMNQLSKSTFNSEYFKIEIRNLPQFGFGEIKKFLKKLQLNPVKVKALQRKGGGASGGVTSAGHVAYICFANEQDKILALKKLNGITWKRKTIIARESVALMDPFQKSRLDSKQPTQTVGSSSAQATVPLVGLPYDEQLKLKEIDLLNILQTYAIQMQKTNNNLQDALTAKMTENNGLPCQWNGLKPSPEINCYRNKCEFTIGKNAAGQKIVGFRLGKYADGSIEVCSVADLPHIPDAMKRVTQIFGIYVQESTLDVFNPETNAGELQQLKIRFSKSTNEIMVIVGVNILKNDPVLEKLAASIVDFFTQKAGKEINVTSLYIQRMEKKKRDEEATNPWIHIYGQTFITEILCGYKFRLSPSSFFQINTGAAEVLYQTAIDLSKLTNQTTMLDICCGTGSIGICFSKHCAQVFGVEINPDAIKDAEINLTENQIKNCTFYTGNSDDYIATLIHQVNTNDLLAVIDPPRAGLSTGSISALRNAKGLQRFIYISCSPKDALRNWIDLGRNPSKSYKGNPFVPVAAVGVDMFPHTKHTELLLLFERIEI